MKFGLFNLMQRRDTARPHREIFTDMADMVKLAEDIGFDIAWFAEHHFSDYSLCPSPMMAAAWCAPVTKRIRLAPGVLVLPLYHPLRLAQEIGMLDQMCDGRFVLGVGTGYQDYEFDRFGVNLREGGDRFLEFLDILEIGLTTGEVEYQGKFYTVPRAMIAVPTMQGLPEVVVAGVLNHPGIRRRVAQSNYIPLLSPGWNPFAMMEDQKARYAQVYNEIGKDPAEMRLALMRFVHVADNRKDALEAAENFRYSTRVAVALRFNYGEFEGTVHKDIPAKEEPTLEQMIENMVIGDAEHCAEMIVDEIRRLGPYSYSCFMQGGWLDAKLARSSLEKFGAEVLPLIEKEIGDLDQIGEAIEPQQPMAAAE